MYIYVSSARMRCGVVLCCFVLCPRCAQPSLAHVNTPVLDLAWGSGGRIHTRMHVYTPRMHIHMHIHACSHTLVYTCVGAHTCRHMCMYIQRVDTGNEARVVLCTSTSMCVCTSVGTHTWIHTCNDCGCSKLVYTHSGTVQFSSVRLCTPDHAHVHSVA